jgi:hypothetical protein
VSGIRRIARLAFLLLLSGGALFMSLVAYYLFYTSGSMPSPHVRGASFLGSLVTYAVFFAIGLIGLRLVLGDLGMAAAARHFERAVLRYVLPALLVFGLVVPLAIGTK